MTRKGDLDRDVALETGIGEKRVKLVTQTFISKVMAALLDGQEVTLDGFGRMHLAVQGGAPPPHARFGTGEKNSKDADVRFRVHFKKSVPFAKAVKSHFKENARGKIRRRRVR